MTQQVIMAGFGGQGMLLAGQILAYAGLEEGKNVSWLPSYGPEMRGGTANCSVVVSDSEIGAPVFSEADTVIVMNRPSLEKFESAVKPGGILIVNSSLIDIKATRDDIKVVYIEANKIAEEVGSSKAANMVALGAYIELAKTVKPETAIKCLAKKMGERKAKLIPMNEKAMAEGAKATK